MIRASEDRPVLDTLELVAASTVDGGSSGLELVPAEATIHMANARGLILEWGDVLICLYSGPTMTDDFDAVLESIRSTGKKLVCTVGITADAPIPEADARKVIADFMFSSEYFLATALIFRGTGLRASMVRTLMMGMRMMSRTPIPSKVMGEGVQALTWLRETVPELSIPAGLPKLVDNVLDLRSAS